MSGRVQWLLVLGAMLVALAARAPGVAWGTNFPGGFHIHHPDEWTHVTHTDALIEPGKPPAYVHYYPEGMAAQAAVLVAVANKAAGDRVSWRPPVERTAIAGRIVSLLYGVLTIGLVALLGWRLFRDRRVGIVAAWLLALGGLHVSQSHMFLADVPSIFWMLLGTWLLIRDLEGGSHGGSENLRWAAAAFGVAFGLKLAVAALPSLGLVALARGPKLKRVLHTGVFFAAGFLVITAGMYDTYELLKTFAGATGDPYVYNRLQAALFHLIELPRSAGLPLTVFGLVGAVLLGRRVFAVRDPVRRRVLWIAVLLPIVIHTVLLVAKLDHFPRHLLPYFPWLALTAAWCLVRLGDRLGRVPAMALIAVVLLYQAVFVYEGERVYLDEPRNEAARWLEDNTAADSTYFWRRHRFQPGRKHVWFPDDARPPTLVIEMMNANHYLSGVGFRDSYPTDYRGIHGWTTELEVSAHQDLFRGKSEYEEVARFSEEYFLPERTLVGKLLGDRSGPYVTEVVIFTKR